MSSVTGGDIRFDFVSFFITASSSSSSQAIKVKDRRYLSKEELLYYRPNSRITVLPAHHPKNLLLEDYLVLTSDENQDIDQTIIPIALFENTWHIIHWSKTLQRFFLGKAAKQFHAWDQERYIDQDQENRSDHEEEPTNDQEEEPEDEDSDTTDTKEEDPTADNTNQEIRNAPVPLEARTPRKSPLELHPIVPLPPPVFQSVNLPSMVQMSSTQLAPTQVSTSQPAGTSGSSGSAQPAPANPQPATPQDIQNSLRAALRRGPPAGGGGPPGGGGGGGAGGPPGPAQPAAAQPQAVIPAAQDVKTMGQLPQTFYGDRMKADDFIEEVKGYLRLNHDVAGFNSPMKKVAFTLTLIKGEDTAGWTRDLGAWLDRLDPAVDNVPALWDQFLLEFADQFQDTQREDRARVKLEQFTMKFPEIDQYIAQFEELARQAGYVQGNPETTHFFIKGLAPSIVADVF